MRFKIYRPKLLAMTVLLLLGLTSVAVIAANEQRVYEVPAIPSVPFTPQLSDEDMTNAVKIAEASGIIKQINGGQDWKIIQTTPAKIEGIESAKVIAEWKTPVSSDGPWQSVKCQGTREVHITTQVNDITRLAIYVDMENNQVSSYSVAGPTADEADLPDVIAPKASPIDDDTIVKIYDFKSGDAVYDGKHSELGGNLCPAGKHDD